MRSVRDRIRHALSFEIIGLALVTPLGAWAFQLPMHDIGIVGFVSATIATVWNFLYNYLFDLGLKHRTGSTEKSGLVRILHATLFEFGLLAMMVPLISWYLNVSLWTGFLMELSFALFYMGYAYVFNLAYDRLFPLPEWKQDQAPT